MQVPTVAESRRDCGRGANQDGEAVPGASSWPFFGLRSFLNIKFGLRDAGFNALIHFVNQALFFTLNLCCSSLFTSSTRSEVNSGFPTAAVLWGHRVSHVTLQKARDPRNFGDSGMQHVTCDHGLVPLWNQSNGPF